MLRVERDVVAAVIRQSAALSVYAAAQPEPRFTWYNGSTPLTPPRTSSEERRFDINIASNSASTGERWDNYLYRHKSTLTLYNVDVWDFTEYRVVVDNDYGSNYTSLRLVQASTSIRYNVDDYLYWFLSLIW